MHNFNLRKARLRSKKVCSTPSLVGYGFGQALGGCDRSPAADFKVFRTTGLGHSGHVLESGQTLGRGNCHELELASTVEGASSGAGAQSEGQLAGGNARVKLCGFFVDHVLLSVPVTVSNRAEPKCTGLPTDQEP